VSGWSALYIFMLAAFTGYVVISAVPVILHTPLMSGANFVHGIVLVGAMIALGFSHSALEITIATIAVVLAAMNVHGGYVVTVRMLAMFKSGRERPAGADEPGDRTAAADEPASGAAVSASGAADPLSDAAESPAKAGERTPAAAASGTSGEATADDDGAQAGPS